MKNLRVLFALLIAGGICLFTAAAAGAGTIASPQGNPYVVATDAHGVPIPFTIRVSGFQPGSIVYVDYRQCQIRAASTNAEGTADQAFLPIVFGSTGGGHHSGSSSGTVVIVVALIALAVALVAGMVLARRRRASVSTG